LSFFTHLWRILNNESGQLTSALLNLETESRRLFESPFRAGPTEQELAGIETLRLQADPTRRLAAARTRFGDVEGPGIDAALVAAGLGRSGAIGEARAQGIAALTLPIESQVAEAQGQLGEAQLGLGSRVSARGFSELERRRVILAQLQQLRTAQATVNASIAPTTSRGLRPGGIFDESRRASGAARASQTASRGAGFIGRTPPTQAKPDVGELPPVSGGTRAPTSLNIDRLAEAFQGIRGSFNARQPAGPATLGPLGPGGTGDQPAPGTLGFGGINPTIDPFSPGFLVDPAILERSSGSRDFSGFNPDPRRVTRRPIFPNLIRPIF